MLSLCTHYPQILRPISKLDMTTLQVARVLLCTPTS